MSDEDYGAMKRFFGGLRGGRWFFFGTSGDLGHLQRLMGESGFSWEVRAHDDLTKDGWTVESFTFRLT